MKHKYGQIGDHKLNYNHYEQLYDAEKKVEIKVVRKLTEYHIKPQKLQAMNVRLATQFLEEFLDMLNQTEARKDVKLIASNQTVESLRVTSMSVLSIIEFLHSEGVSYILTVKLNQDPLERFLGLVRSFESDEDHPTVTKSSQLFRLLSLYTPVKVAVKGNCESGSDRVLLSAFESLGEKRREALVRKSAMKDKVWQQLMSIPFHDLSRVPDDHGYNVPSPEATALYYLAGYVAFKLKKTTRCEVCKEDALGRRDSLPKKALLVIEREYPSLAAMLAAPRGRSSGRNVDHDRPEIAPFYVVSTPSSSLLHCCCCITPVAAAAAGAEVRRSSHKRPPLIGALGPPPGRY
ncbi:hypothetical protein HPB50_012802 [Hyalomma asiaticum]|uniref:Uncharacterized protein n=1 Tax=Hyalomma asiaticum TaxID=266040 RepID=A0ACB7SSD8_HYAAI|nr:hypothetical protein HPB50_012802 [Hyalomma asiaticum]